MDELIKRDLELKELENEEKKKKSFMKEKIIELKKNVKLNPNLQHILDEYIQDFKNELDEKKEQLDAMKNISSYIDILYKTNELSKEQLDSGIYQQKDLLKRMKDLNDEIDEIEKIVSL